MSSMMQQLLDDNQAAYLLDSREKQLSPCRWHLAHRQGAMSMTSTWIPSKRFRLHAWPENHTAKTAALRWTTKTNDTVCLNDAFNKVAIWHYRWSLCTFD